ncbi:MAG: hypothetical protein M3N21_05660 [Actinomycetota bacterium]|nr:hypothetical protein [Actinomycetota bacterium]
MSPLEECLTELHRSPVIREPRDICGALSVHDRPPRVCCLNAGHDRPPHPSPHGWARLIGSPNPGTNPYARTVRL